MAVRGVAKRYARAVFELAGESGRLDEWMADLTTLANAASDPVVGAFLTDPNVRESEKQSAMASLFPRDDQQLVRNLAQMLVDRRRIEIAPELLEVYRDLVLDARGIAIAEVTTAVELTDAEQADVRERIGRIVGKQIELR